MHNASHLTISDQFCKNVENAHLKISKDFFCKQLFEIRLLNLSINVVIQTHHAQFKNKTISFLICFIGNFLCVNDQNVNFLHKPLRNRDAL